MKSTTKLRVSILAVLISVAIVSSLWAVFRTGDWEGLFLNLGTEMAGAAVTYFLFELVIGHQERRESEKRELVEKLRSAQIKEVIDALEPVMHFQA